LSDKQPPTRVSPRSMRAHDGIRHRVTRLARQTRLRVKASLAEPSDEIHNEHCMYKEAVFQALSSAGPFSFIGVFLVRLGAPNWLVGVNTSLPALVTILAVLPMAAWVQRQRSLVKTVIRARLVFRAFISAIAFTPLLPASIASYAMVGLRGIAGIPSSALNVAGTTLMGQVTSPRRRPRMLSVRMTVMGIFAAAVGFLSGQWLDAVPYPWNYQALFLTAILAALGSMWAIRGIRLPEKAEQAVDKKQRVGIKEMLPLIKSQPSFRNYMLAAFVFRIGMSMPMALYAIYRVRDLGSTDSWLGLLMTVERLMTVFSYYALTRLLTRPRFRSWLWVGCLCMSLYPFTTALSITPGMLVIPSLVIGVFSPAMNIFMTDTLFEVSPEDQRPAFVAVNSLLANAAAFAAPLLGTLLADATGIRVALVICASVRALGSLAFYWMNVGAKHRQRTLAPSV